MSYPEVIGSIPILVSNSSNLKPINGKTRFDPCE